MAQITIPKHMEGCRIVGGLPVPKVVAPMRNGRSELRPSTWIKECWGATLMTVWVPESGPPDFGKYDDELHRQCMAGGWCHVCGRTVKFPLVCIPNDRPQFMEIDGRPVPVVVQPWVCPECLAFAVVHCPPLRAAVEAGTGFVVCPQETRLIATYWRPVNPGDPIPPEGATVLSMFKLGILRGAMDPLDQWASRAHRIRRRMGVAA